MTLIAYDHKGNKLELNSSGKKGGEGEIYFISGNNKECAKIYHPEKINIELRHKILTMMDNPPNNPSWSRMTHKPIAWVNSVLYKDKKKLSFIGFTMPLIDTKRFYESHKYYDLSDRLIGFGGDFTWKHLLITAMNLSSTVSAIHEKGHRIGDLREKNILISPNALVTLIDCDSFQIMDKSTGKSFYTRVGTGEYLPPELMDKNFKESNYDRYYSDVFALGILIFKLLMNGVHPYQARGSLLDEAPSTQDKIKKGYFAYCGVYRGVEPPNYALPYDIIPPSVQSLFYRCFVEGHKLPFKRPSAKDWYITLGDEAKKIKDCRIYVNHKYAGVLSYCPWCKLEKEKRIIIFPSRHKPKNTISSHNVGRNNTHRNTLLYILAIMFLLGIVLMILGLLQG